MPAYLKNESRIQQGRCEKRGKDYVPWFKLCESRVHGTQVMYYDPRAGREVYFLSEVKSRIYLYLRWKLNAADIREYYCLDPEKWQEACRKVGKRSSSSGFKTMDFLVDYWDAKGRLQTMAIHVKDPAENMEEAAGMKTLAAETWYWQQQGVKVVCLSGDMVSDQMYDNLKQMLPYMEERSFFTSEERKIHLAATRQIPVDLTLPLLPQLERIVL